MHNNPLIYTDPSGYVAESQELFDINLKINQHKTNWHHYNSLYINSVGSIKSYYKSLMDANSAAADLLREENSHLEGILKATQSVQTVQILTYSRYIISDGTKDSITVRVDGNNTVYYALPRDSISTGESIHVQSKANEEYGNQSKKIAGIMKLPSDGMKKIPIMTPADILLQVVGTAEVPTEGTTTTMASIEQLNEDYIATFVTQGGKVVDFVPWRDQYFGTKRPADIK
ncbi:hypothetical protein [Paenibacillus chungangensis]|uniref:Uncharacterized protein n=1 Tax=Paenibacillus chungangensis TaxID=696535 RepID=A0ABW3HNU0_9BACL